VIAYFNGSTSAVLLLMRHYRDKLRMIDCQGRRSFTRWHHAATEPLYSRAFALWTSDNHICNMTKIAIEILEPESSYTDYNQVDEVLAKLT